VNDIAPMNFASSGDYGSEHMTEEEASNAKRLSQKARLESKPFYPDLADLPDLRRNL
jgi:hypothetical protein